MRVKRINIVGNVLSFLCIWLILVASVPATAGEVNVKKLYKYKWTKAESQSFTVVSNASRKQTQLMLEELENFSFFMSKLLGYKQKVLERKVPVILVKNGASFSSLGISNEYAGVFTPRDGGIIYARADKFRASSKGVANWGRLVVLHELVHLLNNNSSIGLASPPWYNEGIAEYFGTYTQKKNKIIVGELSVLGDRFYSMITAGGGKFRSVESESLFKTEQSELRVGKKNSRKQRKFTDRFYARSVAVVHYLNSQPDLRQSLYKYLTLIERGYSVDETFQHVFEMSFDEFDKRVNDYIGGRFVNARVFDIGGSGIEFPKVSIATQALSQRGALEFLYPKLALLSPNLISEEELERMNTRLEQLVPDFFNKK